MFYRGNLIENPAYLVALVLGAVMLLSVCFLYVKHQVLQLGDMSLSGFAVLLVGMSVWKTVDVSVDEKGFKAKLEQAIATANDAKAQVAQVKQVSSKNSEAVVAVKDAVEAIKTQGALREIGLYKGPLDGQWDAATKKSIIDFQDWKNLPKTGTIDSKTLKELKLKNQFKFSLN